MTPKPWWWVLALTGLALLGYHAHSVAHLLGQPQTH